MLDRWAAREQPVHVPQPVLLFLAHASLRTATSTRQTRDSLNREAATPWGKFSKEGLVLLDACAHPFQCSVTHLQPPHINFNLARGPGLGAATHPALSPNPLPAPRHTPAMYTWTSAAKTCGHSIACSPTPPPPAEANNAEDPAPAHPSACPGRPPRTEGPDASCSASCCCCCCCCTKRANSSSWGCARSRVKQHAGSSPSIPPLLSLATWSRAAASVTINSSASLSGSTNPGRESQSYLTHPS